MRNRRRAGQRTYSPKREAFAQAVAKGATASDAYRKAYGQGNMSNKTINEKASRLMGKLGARISALRAPALVQAAETTTVDLTRLFFEDARIGLSDVGQLYDADGNMIPIHKLPEDVRRAVASVKVRKDGKGQNGTVIEVKLWNKGEAIDRLRRTLGGYDKDNDQKHDPIDDIPREVRKEMLAYINELIQRREIKGTLEGNAISVRPAPKKLKPAHAQRVARAKSRARTKVSA